ncbi:MAG: hypothetical protein HQL28_03890 [Candidatus Omnitrophica bacterium]|nr:hypothetical protein [Candidatus Omnitrophota bacterium]
MLEEKKKGREKVCEVCGKPFVVNKYRPNQEVCSSLECQYQRQLENMKEWRKNNPNYFKYKESQDKSWKQTCRERSLEWRRKHKEYLQLYREANKERHRVYMRDYMRKYRQMKKEGIQEGAEPTLPGNPETPVQQ